MPYRLDHYGRYQETTDYIYLEEDDGQFKIQRRSRFRLHPGIAPAEKGGREKGTTQVLQFHGWEKGAPAVLRALTDDEEDDHLKDHNVLDTVIDFSETSSEASSTQVTSSPPVEEEQPEDEPEEEEEEKEEEIQEEVQEEVITEPVTLPELPPIEHHEPTTEQATATQRRKKAIYRRGESGAELESRRARMQLALDRRRARLAELNSNTSKANTKPALKATELSLAGDRHGTFIGRPSMVKPNEDLYPAEYRHTACLKRVFDYPDLPDLDLASKPKMPPTKIQISVLDVLPAVWAAQFVPVTATPRKAPRVSLNAGEMSHAEVARRTEKAIKRNEERAAEKEERRARLAQARAAREAQAAAVAAGGTPKPVAGSKTPKSTPRASKSTTPAPTPRRRKRPPPPTPPPSSSTITPKPTESKRERKDPAKDVESALSYSARVFASIERELTAQLKISPKRQQRIKSVLKPKLQGEKTYEQCVVESMADGARQDPVIWNNIVVPFDSTKATPVPKTRPVESILTKTECEYALSAFSSTPPPAPKAAPRPAPPPSSTTPSRITPPPQPVTLGGEKGPKRVTRGGKLNTYSFGGGENTTKHPITLSNNTRTNNKPKNLRKLSKDYSPKSEFVGSIPDRAGPERLDQVDTNSYPLIPDDMKTIVQARVGLRTRNKSVK